MSQLSLGSKLSHQCPQLLSTLLSWASCYTLSCCGCLTSFSPFSDLLADVFCPLIFAPKIDGSLTATPFTLFTIESYSKQINNAEEAVF